MFSVLRRSTSVTAWITLHTVERVMFEIRHQHVQEHRCLTTITTHHFTVKSCHCSWMMPQTSVCRCQRQSSDFVFLWRALRYTLLVLDWLFALILHSINLIMCCKGFRPYRHYSITQLLLFDSHFLFHHIPEGLCWTPPEYSRLTVMFRFEKPCTCLTAYYCKHLISQSHGSYSMHSGV